VYEEAAASSTVKERKKERKLSHGCYILFQTITFPITDTGEAEEEAKFSLRHGD